MSGQSPGRDAVGARAAGAAESDCSGASPHAVRARAMRRAKTSMSSLHDLPPQLLPALLASSRLRTIHRARRAGTTACACRRTRVADGRSRPTRGSRILAPRRRGEARARRARQRRPKETSVASRRVRRPRCLVGPAGLWRLMMSERILGLSLVAAALALAGMLRVGRPRASADTQARPTRPVGSTRARRGAIPTCKACGRSST